jgi:hypothetical protein
MVVAAQSGMNEQADTRREDGIDLTSWSSRFLARAGGTLRRYHRHQVRGMSHLVSALRSDRPVVMVGNHVMDVADPLMLIMAIHEQTGRIIPGIGHQIIFFELPIVRTMARSWPIIPSRQMELAEETLRRKGALLLYPGAGGEAALRSYRREPYCLKWYGRLGFVELALRTNAAVLFVSGIGIEEMYYQTDRAIPSALFRLVDKTYLDTYRGVRLQLGLAGLHIVPGWLPFPVKITHVISPPLELDYALDPSDRREVEAQQVRVWAQCLSILDAEIVRREHDSDWLDSVLRSGMSTLEWVGL